MNFECVNYLPEYCWEDLTGNYLGKCTNVEEQYGLKKGIFEKDVTDTYVQRVECKTTLPNAEENAKDVGDVPVATMLSPLSEAARPIKKRDEAFYPRAEVDYMPVGTRYGGRRRRGRETKRTRKRNRSRKVFFRKQRR